MEIGRRNHTLVTCSLLNSCCFMLLKNNYGDMFDFFVSDKDVSLSFSCLIWKVWDTVCSSVPRVTFVYLVTPSRGTLRKNKAKKKTNKQTKTNQNMSL